jgi:glycosyltransferase involved in cell wall biosynthesis
MSNEFSPLVSIITPTFNHERYIGPCIESVLKQTYQNWEQVVIDDGSTDGTAEIARGFADPRIRYEHQENAGIEALAHTYNRALGMSNGELIAILEGDDLWPPEKLSTLVPAFPDQSVVLAYGAVADIASDGTWNGGLSRSVRKRMRLPREILFNDPRSAATRHMLRADGVELVPPSTVVIRRTALDAIGGFQYVPGLCVTDFPTFISLSLTGTFLYTSQVMGYRRRHTQSATFRNLETIIQTAHEFANNFALNRNINLTREQQASVERSWRKVRCGCEFTSGRLNLTDGDWKKARLHFTRAMSPGQPRVLAAAATGWLLSWIHRDIEILARMVGLASLKN